MTSLVAFNQNEITIENATILENKNVAYSIRKYKKNETDDTKFQESVDDILKKTNFLIKVDEDEEMYFADEEEEEDYKVKNLNPLRISPQHIRDCDIKKPEGKEPSIIKLIVNKFSSKFNKPVNSEASSDKVSKK